MRYIILLALSLCVYGCDRAPKSENYSRINTLVDLDNGYYIVCDHTTNIAYLKYDGPNRHAMTAYLDADGKPARCTDIK